MNAQPKLLVSKAEYFEREARAEYKSEYCKGEIFAMAGGAPEHGLIAMNIGVTLGTQLRLRPCRIYSSDVRIGIEAADRYTYPDLSVVCGKPQVEADNNILNPVVLVEVLSTSTEKNDREGKFEDYKSLASLQSYVLVSQYRPKVEVFTRQASGKWLLSEARGLDQTLRLDSIDCDLALSDIYLKVDFPA